LNQGLGRPILGTPTSLQAVQRDQVLNYHSDRYRAGHMFITASGALDPDMFLSEVTETFGHLEGGDHKVVREGTKATPGINVVRRPVEQVHCCIETFPEGKGGIQPCVLRLQLPFSFPGYRPAHCLLRDLNGWIPQGSRYHQG
jgi:hypothetical protein